jgi:hypothetical protein
MIVTAPMPFQKALDAAEVRSPLLTTGRTADLQQLESAIKRRALWSATVTSGSHLQRIEDGVNGILTGQMDQASARLAIKQFLAEMGYQPDPEKAGGLQDLSSDVRIDLQLETNVDTARGYGWYSEGQQADVLDEWPAWELIDTAPGGDPRRRRDWAARWERCGGQFYDGRMIALVNDLIWQQLGDPAIFPDGLGNPYAPFAFNSAWRLRDIGRDEAVALGLIDDTTELLPQPIDLNGDLQASPDIRSENLRQMMEGTGLGRFDAAGVFHFTPQS